MKLPNDNTMGHCLFTFPTHSQLNVDPITNSDCVSLLTGNFDECVRRFALDCIS